MSLYSTYWKSNPPLTVCRPFIQVTASLNCTMFDSTRLGLPGVVEM
jgi:hypothetical protein